MLNQAPAEVTISSIGEKDLIRDYVKPIFDPDGASGIGDDCAAISVPAGWSVLTSTDRVPADLRAFQAGVIDHAGLGFYLANLNISDIAASGGKPYGLLLNFGLPPDTRLTDFVAICQGVDRAARAASCLVIGGDLSSSVELSLSATSFGIARPDQILRRTGARSGDTVFVSRPVGLTPAAFQFYRSPNIQLSEDETTRLNMQFALTPMLQLSSLLAQSGDCSSCMDNTDGIGQSLKELCELNHCQIVLKEDFIAIPPLVSKIFTAADIDPLEGSLSSGADFSLVGTLRGHWDSNMARSRFGESIAIVGFVTEGDGVVIDRNGELRDLVVQGWSYFS